MKLRAQLIVSLLTLSMGFTSSLLAANVAWWRMGDSDTSPVAGNPTGNDIGGGVFFGAGSGIVDEYGGDNDLFRGADEIDFTYSTDVPAPEIFDPISGNTFANAFSGVSNAVGQRPQGNNTTPAPPAASLETFVKFAGLEDGSGGIDFLYGLSNSSGGWRAQSFADGSIQLQIKEEDNGGDGPYTSFQSGPGILQAGVWQHVALVMAPDATGNDDVFVYVDGEVVVSGNYTNDDMMPASSFPILTGSVFTSEGGATVPIHYDETRYFSHAISPSDFLQKVGAPEVSLIVDRISGEMTLVNTGSGDLEIHGYSITSTNGAINPAARMTVSDFYDASGDMSVDNNDEWTVLSEANSNDDLSEFNFLGDGGVISVGASIALSTSAGLWFPTGNESGLTMTVVLASDDPEIDGSEINIPIEYTGNNDQPLSELDLNHDGMVDGLDWNEFISNHPQNLNTTSLAQAHLMGDLDGDFDNDEFDFRLFKDAYIAQNGAAAFAALLQGNPVPEPSGIVWVALTGLVFTLCHRSRQATKASVSIALCIVSLAVLTQPAEAVLTSAWWRMGDSDGALAIDGNTIGGTAGSGVADDYFSDGDNELLNALAYSDDVPAASIYDPLTQSYVANQWSTVSTGPGLRATASNSTFDPTPNPTPVTVETFVRFDSLSNGNGGGVQFLYQLSNTDGGWRLDSFADGSLTLLIKEPDTDVDGPVQTFSSSAGVLSTDRWYHLAMVMDPDNSGNDDIKVYLNGQTVIEGNYNLSDQLADSSFPLLVGSVFSNDTGSGNISFDETRVFKEAKTPDEFLRVGPLTAVVNTVTGNITLENNSLAPIELDHYQFEGNDNRLLTSFEGMGSRDAVGGGDDPGEVWENAGILSSNSLTQAFLLGTTTVATDEQISLGTAYLAGAEDSDLNFVYYDANFQAFVKGIVEYTDVGGGLPGDFNGDGRVDAADYTVWRNNLGADESALGGNGDASGTVDLGDYATWKTNFGASAAGFVHTTNNVPEPATYVLLMLSVAGLGRLGRLVSR